MGIGSAISHGLSKIEHSAPVHDVVQKFSGGNGCDGSSHKASSAIRTVAHSFSGGGHSGSHSGGSSGIGSAISSAVHGASHVLDSDSDGASKASGGGGTSKSGSGGGIMNTVGKFLGKSGIGDALSGALDIAVPTPVSSAQRTAETAQIKDMSMHRTPALDAKAEKLDKDGQWGLYQDMAKQYRTTHPGIQGWIGTAKMEAAIAAAAAATVSDKGKYNLQRPFQMDPSIKPLGDVPTDSSFPSGHSAAAWAAATVLGNLDPANRGQYEDQARQVQWAREYSGVHLPSDVDAGEQIGRSAGEKFS